MPGIAWPGGDIKRLIKLFGSKLIRSIDLSSLAKLDTGLITPSNIALLALKEILPLIKGLIATL